MNRITRSVAGALIAAASPSSAQDMLTVDQIVALHQAGLGDEAIVAKIRSSRSTFVLGTDEMIALKARGLSGPVIAAMLGSAQGASAELSTDSPDPKVPHAAGAYVLRTGMPARMSRLDAVTASQARTGGILGYALTAGIASMSVRSVIPNGLSRIMLPETRPVFFFFFDESNPPLPASAAWGAGTAAPVTSPAGFSLIRLERKEGRREARIGRVNTPAPSSALWTRTGSTSIMKRSAPGCSRLFPKRRWLRANMASSIRSRPEPPAPAPHACSISRSGRTP